LENLLLASAFPDSEAGKQSLAALNMGLVATVVSLENLCASDLTLVVPVQMSIDMMTEDCQSPLLENPLLDPSPLNALPVVQDCWI
jgi:hypothetical protein